MPNPAGLVAYICDAYYSLSILAPAVATLIVAAVLFLGILTRHVPMGAVMLAVVMALIIGLFPTIIGALGVQIPCR